MMKRGILILLLCALGSTAWAASGTFPELFVPADHDLSIWYLGNIFGSDLLGNLVNVKDTSGYSISGIRLLSVLFGIFNQVALVVGIIIIVYTIIAGTLNTAHEGKPLGEKWNSLWMPVRASTGIAFLVPSGGTGYCLAQSLVMWLTLQGIGAGDQVWNAMVDYFAQGGAIYSNYAQQNSAYLNEKNVNITLGLMGSAPNFIGAGTPPQGVSVDMLKSMTCMSVYNNDKEALALNNNHKYTAYTLPQDTVHVYFGDQTAMLALAAQSTSPPPYRPTSTVGMECGAVVVTAPTEDCVTPEHGGKCGELSQRETIYTTANWNLAQGLQGIANELATNPTSDKNWANYYSSIYTNSALYINYLVGYQDFLFTNPEALKGTGSNSVFALYKKYGWILAGNYYTILSGYKERVEYMTRKMIPPTNVSWLVMNGTSTEPKPKAPNDAYDKAYTAESNFWIDVASDTFGNDAKGEPIIQQYISDYEKSQAVNKMGTGEGKGTSKIGIVNMDEILKKLGRPVMNPGSDKGHKRGSGSRKGQASMATQGAVKNYIHYLTGVGSNPRDLTVAKDPILRASEYGKGLTSSALVIMVAAGAIWVVAAASNVCTGLIPVGPVVEAAIEPIVLGFVALGVFMYTQGAMLGVFIPLIPYVTFFIGVVGWLLQVVEAVAAAPLVAIGLIFPETRDDIWGRAAPAYMLILALFLRPPLMLVGFAAAMIVLWCLTELLNIGFLTLTAVTFRIEDMFGFVVIMTAYTAIFTVVVTRSYELINVVPNKVLNWIGGSGYEVQGAQEAIGAAKGGVQEGAGAVSSGMQKVGESSAGAGKAGYKQKYESAKGSKAGTTPPPGTP